MKTMRKKMYPFLRGVAFATALALTTGGIAPPTASALPRSVCQDYMNQARAYAAGATSWYSYGNILMGLGDLNGAIAAYEMSAAYGDFAAAALEEYAAGCL